ncbi:MAG: hypothetical protein ACUZ8E_00995 [Candidatus Anammoxibacter sp.]
MRKLASHGFEYFIGGISALIFLYGIFGSTTTVVNGKEMLALLFLGGLGMLLAVFVFVVKQVTWYKSKTEELNLKSLQDTNHTTREVINALKQLKGNIGPPPK